MQRRAAVNCDAEMLDLVQNASADELVFYKQHPTEKIFESDGCSMPTQHVEGSSQFVAVPFSSLE